MSISSCSHYQDALVSLVHFQRESARVLERRGGVRKSTNVLEEEKGGAREKASKELQQILGLPSKTLIKLLDF